MKKNKSKRIKLCHPLLGRPLRGKTLLKKLGTNPPKNLEEEGRIQTPGGKKENRCYQCGKPGHFKWECSEGKKKRREFPL
jgi:hypothetical protein